MKCSNTICKSIYEKYIIKNMKKKIISHLAKIGFLKKSPDAPVIFFEIVIGIVLSVISVIIFADIAKDVLDQETRVVDNALSQTVYSWRNPGLTEIMIFISLLGADIIVFAAGLFTIFLTWKKHKREAILFVTVLIIGLLINIILKVIFQRPRPDMDPIMDLSSSYSFPSGHAMNAFIFYSVMSYFVYHFTHNKLLSIGVTVFSLLLILLIGFSRVYLGVHYPSDVLAGFIAGFFVFVTAIVLIRSLTFRNIVGMVRREEKKLRK